MADDTDQADADAQAADAQADDAQAASAGAQDGDGDQHDTLTPEDARKIRSENRAMRQRLKDAEKKLADLSDADLSEKQRLERDLSAEKAGREQLASEVRSLRVEVAAGKLGVRPEALPRVAALIDWDTVEDAADSKQVEKAVRELLKEMPFLSSRPEGLDGGNDRTNGRRGGGGTLTDLLLSSTERR